MFSTFIFILLFYFLQYIYLLIFMILFSFWTVFFFNNYIFFFFTQISFVIAADLCLLCAFSEGTCSESCKKGHFRVYNESKECHVCEPCPVKNMLGNIGNFRVASSLCFKAMLNAKPLIKNDFFICQFHVPMTQFVFPSPRDDQSQEKLTTIFAGKTNCTMGNVSEGRNCPHTNKTHFHNKDCTQPRFGSRKSSNKFTFLLNYYDEMFSMPRKKKR